MDPVNKSQKGKYTAAGLELKVGAVVLLVFAKHPPFSCIYEGMKVLVNLSYIN
jgi:hypothetical protein